jgi:hypothetical protein
VQSLFPDFERELPTDLSTGPGDNKIVTLTGDLPKSVRRNQTRRTTGLEGSLSAKFTGPMPQMAMIAGSGWPRMTPS